MEEDVNDPLKHFWQIRLLCRPGQCHASCGRNTLPQDLALRRLQQSRQNLQYLDDYRKILSQRENQGRIDQ